MVATVDSFHAPAVNLTPNNARSASSGSSCIAAAAAASRCRVNSNSNNSGNNWGSAQRKQRRAAAVGTTTPALRGDHSATAPQHRRSGSDIFELNAGGGAGGGEGGFYTPADLEAYSKPWGITLHYRGTLNTYRIEAHRANGEVAGYTTGFYLGDLLHLDKVQVCVCVSLLLPYACLFVVLSEFHAQKCSNTFCRISHACILELSRNTTAVLLLSKLPSVVCTTYCCTRYCCCIRYFDYYCCFATCKHL